MENILFVCFILGVNIYIIKRHNGSEKNSLLLMFNGTIVIGTILNLLFY